jgi:hypothetical protein
MRITASLLLIAACASEPGTDDITGPFTGTTHRFAVDAIEMPATNTAARELGDDLDGNESVDNQVGMVVSTLTSQGLGTKNGADMITSGAIASSFEIVADDLMNDPTVSVLYRGADGEEAVAVGGEIVDGHFRSNRTATTRIPGRARAHLPVWINADPSVVDIDGLEIDLKPDGHGGYEALVRGVLDSEATLREAYKGAAQMLAADPNGHLTFIGIFDAPPRDFIVSEDEFVTSSFMMSLLSPDITYRDRKALSIGFRAHITPCAEGRCATTEPADKCHDRVKDGDESDVDCGGSCSLGCPTSGQCTQASDCYSNTCTDAGVCGAPSCTNGVRDGFETDVDCGSQCKTACDVGERCYTDSDCGAGHTCGKPCGEDEWFCDGYDRCQ